MSLSALQQALARLYTDAGLRVRFLADAEATGRELGLTGDDLACWLALAPDRVQVFAASLQHKRFGAVNQLLPRSRAADPAGFATAFYAYAAQAIPAGSHKHRRDALAFVRHWLPQLQAHDGWRADLLRFEALSLYTQFAPRGLWLRCFRYRVWLTDLDPKYSERGLILWFGCKPLSRIPWYHLRVELPDLLRWK